VLLFGCFFFFVNRNRLQIFGLENLAALQAMDVIYAVTPIEKFGSLVLTILHSEISTYSRLHRGSVKFRLN
jgi:hypothetical protein